MRYTGKPADILAELEEVDAENESKLSALFLQTALRVRGQAESTPEEYRNGVIERAVWNMTRAQDMRR